MFFPGYTARGILLGPSVAMFGIAKPQPVSPEMAVAAVAVAMVAMQKLNENKSRSISAFSGKGALKVYVGPRVGEIGLGVKDNEFESARASIPLGSKEKDPMWGSLGASWGPKSGVELAGQFGMKITEGLSGEGELSYGKAKPEAGAKGLNARLRLDATILKGEATKPLMQPIQKSAVLMPLTIPPIPPLMFIYGKVGAEMGFTYKADPPLKAAGSVGVQGINLREQTYASADADLSLGGKLSAEFVGKPKLGIGAKVLAENFGSLEGGVKIPITAAAATEPKLKTTVMYDEQRKPKGNFKLNLPISFGIKAALEPYAHVRALYGLVDKEWPLKAMEPIDLLPPREVFNFPIEFGNLETKQPDEVAPKSESELKAADEGEVEQQKVKSATTAIETPREKAEEAPSVTNSLGATGPFDYRFALDKLKGAFGGVKDSVAEVWANLKNVVLKVGALASDAAAAIRERAGKMTDEARRLMAEAGKAATLAKDTVVGFASWIKEAWQSKSGEAWEKVRSSKTLKDVPMLEKVPIDSFHQAVGVAFWTLWGAAAGSIFGPPGAFLGGALGGMFGWWMGSGSSTPPDKK